MIVKDGTVLYIPLYRVPVCGFGTVKESKLSFRGGIPCRTHIGVQYKRVQCILQDMPVQYSPGDVT